MADWDLAPFERQFLEAAVDPSLWVGALERITSITASYGTVLVPTTGGVLKTIPFTDSMSSSAEAYVRDGWHLRDERNRGIAIMQQFGVVEDLDIFRPEAIDKLPYYQDFLAPHRLRWFAGVGIFLEDDIWCLSIQRTLDQDPFSRQEKQQLAKLSKTMSTGAVMGRTLNRVASTGILEAFAISGTAAVLVNRHGLIFQANQAAERLLSGDIKIAKGKLRGSTPFVELDRALSRLLNKKEASLEPPIPLARAGRGPMLAYPAKLPGPASNILADCQAVVVLIDPETRKRPPEFTLRKIYGLSDAEARLCVQLASGEPLERAAERLGISKETSRTQLKGIFAKIGVHRQAELIAVLGTLLSEAP